MRAPIQYAAAAGAGTANVGKSSVNNEPITGSSLVNE